MYSTMDHIRRPTVHRQHVEDRVGLEAAVGDEADVAAAEDDLPSLAPDDVPLPSSLIIVIIIYIFRYWESFIRKQWTGYQYSTCTGRLESIRNPERIIRVNQSLSAGPLCK
mmetsp:Transcript_39001/g.79821  ORF Transcript_39001/g.79821 Transcript_39001/m.79821 type:complete len:111 (+) Transcript_39001:1548-1880(+)